MKEFNNMEELTTFIDERRQVVVDDVNRIADEYINNGEQAALTMLNSLVLGNDLKVWEANVIQSKVWQEVLSRQQDFPRGKLHETQSSDATGEEK